jgi:3-oxoadipate enol-lactonase
MTSARYQGVSAVAAALASATANDDPFELVSVREGDMRLYAEEFTRSYEPLGRAEKADHRLIDCPTLIVAGDEDTVGLPSVAKDLAGKIGGAKAVILNRCGRWTPIERSKDGGKLLLEFVRGVPL